MSDTCNLANICNVSYTGYMDLNIRDFPDELVLKLKREALDRKISLRQLIIDRLSGEMVYSDLVKDLVKADDQRVASAPKVKSARKRATPDIVVDPEKFRRAIEALSQVDVTPANPEDFTVDGVPRCEHRMSSVCDDCAKKRKL